MSFISSIFLSSYFLNLFIIFYHPIATGINTIPKYIIITIIPLLFNNLCIFILGKEKPLPTERRQGLSRGDNKTLCIPIEERELNNITIVLKDEATSLTNPYVSIVSVICIVCNNYFMYMIIPNNMV